jgi:hypothetical protein
MDPADAPRAPLPDLVLWRSDRCHLCEDTTGLVEQLLGQRAAAGLDVPRLVVRRIAEDPAVERVLFEQVPVLEVAGRRLPLALRVGPIRAFLDDAYGGARVEPSR